MFKKTKGYSIGGQAKSKGYKTGGKVRKPESNAIETAIRNSIFDPKPTKGPKPKGPRSGKVLFDAKPQESKVRKKPGMARGGTPYYSAKDGGRWSKSSKGVKYIKPKPKPQERKVRRKPGI
tara:strand:+ start:302 stop:664 length:363 start_codon:yes stop_codon:yes gene_type:complete